jgi:hypothetical protein
MFFVVASIFLYAILALFFKIWRVSPTLGFDSVAFRWLFVLFFTFGNGLFRAPGRLVVLALARGSLSADTLFNVFGVFAEKANVSIVKRDRLFLQTLLGRTRVCAEVTADVEIGGAAPSDARRVDREQSSRPIKSQGSVPLNLLLFPVVLDLLDGVEK